MLISIFFLINCQIPVLLSKNTDIIYKFMSQIRVNNFYINQNPFLNGYEFEIDEKKLVYNKKIFLKKI